MRFGRYYRCHQEIIRITSLHLGGNRPTCTTYRTLNCDIPHSSYPYIAWVDEASEIKYLAQGHKYVGANRARTHNLLFMSPAVSLDHTRSSDKLHNTCSTLCACYTKGIQPLRYERFASGKVCKIHPKLQRSWYQPSTAMQKCIKHAQGELITTPHPATDLV